MTRMPALLLSLLLPLCAGAVSEARPYSLAPSWVEEAPHMGVRLLGSLALPATEVDGHKLQSLSGLAWDEDEGVLYAISDNGSLFHLIPRFRDGRLAALTVAAAYALRDEQGQPLALRRRRADAEGLTLINGANGRRGDGELIVSFESRPRIQRHRPDGRWLGDLPLPAALADRTRLASPNRAFEAVALDLRPSVLLATEAPTDDSPPGHVPIASEGRVWWYPLGTAAGSALVAMEALPDGSLLTLERAFVDPLRPLVISLRRTRLPERSNSMLQVEDVAVFSSADGWRLDNFEGLSRHRDKRFFMVSDDNDSVLQRTLLVYFELL
ncbi:MAG TPA: esterase-like activity of phytase family protein [Candidatus Competibacteraceae bacterium]|nr:esterase-like activity of phytase family protein [Candidatus Competibacteraceae bacterium]